MCIAIGTSLLDYVDMYRILKLVLELPAHTQHSNLEWNRDPMHLLGFTQEICKCSVHIVVCTHAHIYVKYKMYDTIPVYNLYNYYCTLHTIKVSVDHTLHGC